MAKTKIEFISKGFKEILQEPKVADVVSTTAQTIEMNAIRNAVGSGMAELDEDGLVSNNNTEPLFESETVIGYNGSRWVGFVHSVGKAGAIAESEHKALSKAVK